MSDQGFSLGDPRFQSKGFGSSVPPSSPGGSSSSGPSIVCTPGRLGRPRPPRPLPLVPQPLPLPRKFDPRRVIPRPFPLSSCSFLNLLVWMMQSRAQCWVDRTCSRCLPVPAFPAPCLARALLYGVRLQSQFWSWHSHRSWSQRSRGGARRRLKLPPFGSSCLLVQKSSKAAVVCPSGIRYNLKWCTNHSPR